MKLLILFMASMAFASPPVLLDYGNKVKTLLVSNMDKTGFGSAFVMEYKGKKYVLTAGHACHGKDKMIVNGVTLDVVISRHDTMDYCVLAYDKKLKDIEVFKPAKKEAKVTMLITETLNSIDSFNNLMARTVAEGHFLGMIPEVLIDRLPKCERKCAAYRYLAAGFGIDVKVTPGNSGSPVFNTQKNIVGIIIQTRGEIGVFTPIWFVLDHIDGKPFNLPNMEQEKEDIKEVAKNICGPEKFLIASQGFRDFNIFCIEDK